MKKTEKILEMNDLLFIQRKRVIAILYEARSILKMNLPRIKVRIVEFEKRKNEIVLGRCFINKDYITISKDITNWSDDFLRSVVWHELAHAFFNAQHDETCPLMHPTQLDLSVPSSVLAQVLKKLATNSRSFDLSLAYYSQKVNSGSVTQSY
jgi:hypothetical protein